MTVKMLIENVHFAKKTKNYQKKKKTTNILLISFIKHALYLAEGKNRKIDDTIRRKIMIE